MSEIQSVSVVGLGKLGLPIAATLASKELFVIGVDSNPAVLDAVRKREPPFFESGLENRLRRAKKLETTENIAESVRKTDMTYVIVPTPSKNDGSFSLEAVLSVTEQIGIGLKNKPYHLVVVGSTVSPGSTEGPVKEVLEKTSGKKTSEDFGLCYNPEFVALGEVIKGFLNPDFVLVGESDERAGSLLERFYKSVCENNPSVVRINPTEAEIAKIAVNTYVTCKISFANLLARVCEKTPRANVDNVTRALAQDKRIGPAYLKGGLPYGGPCFPRDNAALVQYANSLSVDARLPHSVDVFNKQQVPYLARYIAKKLPEKGTVGVLGLSFKPNTGVIDESFGIHLAKQLFEQNIRVIVYDIEAMRNAKKELETRVAYARNARDCVEKSDVVVIATPWSDFKSPALYDTARNLSIIDCWRVIDPTTLKNNVKYFALGKGGGW